MKFKIVLLNDIPSHEQRAILTRQLGKCFQREWGKYRDDLTEKDWIDDAFRSSAAKDLNFVALSDEGTLVGTVTLKKANMENKYPTLSPWLSWLVVADEYRGKKISAVLMAKLLTVAHEQGSNTVYLYSHVLKLESYYTKFGWEIHKIPGEETPTYQGKPILLFKGHVSNILALLDGYFKASHIAYDSRNDEYILPDVLSPAASKHKEISPRIEA